MDKVFKILNKYNDKYLHKQKNNIESVKFYNKLFKSQGLIEKVNNDFDYIDFTIKRTSFENMRSIQNEFFSIKEDLLDLWDVISYKEKHFLLYNKLNPYLDTLKSFKVNDNRYFISYFDSLINAYYDHDMLMFDGDNYRKYLYDYSKIVNLENEFKFEAIKADFAQVKYVAGCDNHYVVYSDAINRLYIIKEDDLKSIGFRKQLSPETVKDLSELIIKGDELQLINYIIDNELGSKKVMKKLVRRQRKLNK